jgi:hypothetical protein
MNRRELLKSIALITGGTVLGAELFLSGCKNKSTSFVLSTSDIALLDEVGETIIPTTNTPGAKAAKVGEFMHVYVKDCYTKEAQDIFAKGLSSLDEESKKLCNKSFMDSTVEQRTALLMNLEKEAKLFNKTVEEEQKKMSEQNKTKPWDGFVNTESLPRHYYTMMKELTLFGYFTSKIGVTQALRYLPVPGKFDGNVPYKKGDKAWA